MEHNPVTGFQFLPASMGEIWETRYRFRHVPIAMRSATAQPLVPAGQDTAQPQPKPQHKHSSGHTHCATGIAITRTRLLSVD